MKLDIEFTANIQIQRTRSPVQAEDKLPEIKASVCIEKGPQRKWNKTRRSLRHRVMVPDNGIVRKMRYEAQGREQGKAKDRDSRQIDRKLAVKDSRKECQEGHEGDKPPDNGRFDNHEDSSAGDRARNSHAPTGRRGEMTEVEEPDPGRKGRKEDDV